MTTAIIRHALLTSALATASLLVGCDNGHLIGGVPDDDAGSPPDGGTPPVTDARQIEVLNPLGAQSWTGYIENYMFRSGSDAVRIAFSTDSAGQLVGTVTLGNGPPPPPATDPNVGYPADLLGLDTVTAIDTARSYIAEGFGYSIRSGTLTGGRLRFGVGTWELWTDWCALQTPAPPQGVCDEPVCQTSCLPNWGSMFGPNGCALRNPATNQYEPVDCGKYALCGGFGMVCMCYPSGCTVRDFGTELMFDVAITNDRASGSVAGQLGDHNVHFTKDP